MIPPPIRRDLETAQQHAETAAQLLKEALKSGRCPWNDLEPRLGLRVVAADMKRELEAGAEALERAWRGLKRETKRKTNG